MKTSTAYVGLMFSCQEKSFLDIFFSPQRKPALLLVLYRDDFFHLNNSSVFSLSHVYPDNHHNMPSLLEENYSGSRRV